MDAVFVSVGALFGLVGVALGAFGSHALGARVPPEDRSTFETAVRYQLWHATALIATGLAAARWPSGVLDGAGWAFTLGIVLFSGSLFALVGTGVRRWGAVTPLGGAALLAGWVLFALAPWV